MGALKYLNTRTLIERGIFAVIHKVYHTISCTSSHQMCAHENFAAAVLTQHPIMHMWYPHFQSGSVAKFNSVYFKTLDSK